MVVVLVLLALLAFFLFVPRPAQAQGYQVPIDGAPHQVPQGTDVQYDHSPPSSGDYYDQSSAYGVLATAVAPGAWMQNLEHGGIVVLYNCPQECPDVVQQLTGVYDGAPPSVLFPGHVKMVVAPYPGMSQTISVLAWGWEDDMQTVDKERILAFYRTHVDRGPDQAL